MQEVEQELTGRGAEPWEIIYFKLYKTQIPVIEQAIETAVLILRTDKSLGDDLRGEPGQGRSADIAAVNDPLFQVFAQRPMTAVPARMSQNA